MSREIYWSDNDFCCFLDISYLTELERRRSIGCTQLSKTPKFLFYRRLSNSHRPKTGWWILNWLRRLLILILFMVQWCRKKQCSSSSKRGEHFPLICRKEKNIYFQISSWKFVVQKKDRFFVFMSFDFLLISLFLFSGSLKAFET